MKNALKNNNVRFVMIAKINGLAQEGKKSRIRISRAKTQEAVWPLAYRKHLIGREARNHLLAYAFLRGIPYRKVEPKCSEFNKPTAFSIFKVVEQHAPTYIMYDPYTKTGGGGYKATQEDVQSWLTSEEV